MEFIKYDIKGFRKKETKKGELTSNTAVRNNNIDTFLQQNPHDTKIVIL